MPIYEYQCAACQHKLEALQKFSDPPLTECPVCHQASLRKMVTAAAFKLKGTGWYETDFKNKKEGKAAEKSDGATGSATEKVGSGSSADAGTDNKGAAVADTGKSGKESKTENVAPKAAAKPATD